MAKKEIKQLMNFYSMNVDWINLLAETISDERFKILMSNVYDRYINDSVAPQMSETFRCFENISPKEIKVVILGQDPYHTPRMANGYAFDAVNSFIIPPSLKNILQEIKEQVPEDYEEITVPHTSRISDWSKHGVLLLNRVLTVKISKAGSHADIGWEWFTDSVIEKINELPQPIVFMLWGNKAQEVKKLLTNDKHLVLESAHPSPLSASRGFFGNNHFKLAKEFLEASSVEPVKWTHSVFPSVNRRGGYKLKTNDGLDIMPLKSMDSAMAYAYGTTKGQEEASSSSVGNINSPGTTSHSFFITDEEYKKTQKSLMEEVRMEFEASYQAWKERMAKLETEQEAIAVNNLREALDKYPKSDNPKYEWKVSNQNSEDKKCES